MAVKRRSNKKKISKTGAGLAALAVAAVAGAYLFMGKEGTKNRKKVKGWMLKAKGEVLEKVEKLEGYKEVDEKKYEAIVDTVMKKYKNIKSVNSKEAVTLANDLKKQWHAITKEAKKKGGKKKTKKASMKKRKTARKTARRK